MATPLKDIVNFTGQYLSIAKVKDYCPNGLQVEGSAEVAKIVGGVTASQALIDQAIKQKANAVLVHHGYFWKGENPVVTGIKRRRLKSLLENDMSLLAYHLPLDMHPEIGNNAQLAKKLGFEVTGPLEPLASNSIGLVGKLPYAMTARELQALISEKLVRPCQHIGNGDEKIETIAWCTGAAQGMIEQTCVLGVDAYLSGEISEPTVHIARETGIHYFSAGHHATERDGVRALGQLLANKFEVEFEFIDIDNPV